MGEVKVHRENEERLELIAARSGTALRAWSNWCKNNFTTELMPSPVDILNWEPVKTLVNFPSKDEVVLRQFAELFQEKLLSFVTTRRNQQFWAVINRWIFRDMPLVAPNPLYELRLAVCVFTCGEGGLHMKDPEYDPYRYSMMWYPEFLHHPCNSICRIIPCREGEDRVLNKNPYLRAHNPFSGCRRKAWSADSLAFDDKASRTIKNILEACKLDPKSTTVEVLDKLDLRLVCLKCSFGAKPNGERWFPVRSWRNAVCDYPICLMSKLSKLTALIIIIR